MSCEVTGRGALDYYPCRYGASRLLFRGPKRKPRGDYAVFLGGAETYGRFIARPYPAILEDRLGLAVINLGLPNAGIDAYLQDPSTMEVICQARLVVIQVMGAQNVSNRLYTVHPRRNDRFLKASETMTALFADVDFTEFHFTRHMLRTLHDLSPGRFEVVRAELRQAWTGRMGALLNQVAAPVTLFRFAAQPADADPDALDCDPLLVTQDMLDRLRPRLAALVDCVPSPAALAEGTAGMVFSPPEAQAAAGVLSSACHGEAADALLPVLRDQLGREAQGMTAAE